MKVLLVLCAFGALSIAAEFQDDPEVELPSFMRICSRNDPELGRCIKDSMQQLLPELTNGIPSIDFPAIDPFTQDSSYYEFKNEQMFGSMHIKNSKVYGMSRAQIKDVRAKADDNAFRMEVDLFIPKIISEGKYKGEGRYNVIKVVSKGFFNVTTIDVSVTWKIAGRTIQRNGEEYLMIDKFSMSPEVGDMKVYATGLFPDPGMNQVALDFVNQYWPSLYKQMLPETRRTWEPMMIDIMNKMFNRIPYRRLLPKADL